MSMMPAKVPLKRPDQAQNGTKQPENGRFKPEIKPETIAAAVEATAKATIETRQSLAAEKAGQRQQRREMASERRKSLEIGEKLRDSALKRLRPMAMKPTDARRLDECFDQDRAPRFNLSQKAPTGGDRVMLQPFSIPVDDKGIEITHGNLTKQVMLRAFEEENLSLADLLPYRVRVAWRLVREMARHRGLIRDDEMLLDALEPTPANPDPWTVPETWSRPEKSPALSVRIIEAILDAQYLPEDTRVSRWDDYENKHKTYGGVALMPPDVPAAYLQDPEHGGPDRTPVPTEAYDEANDPALLAYMEILRATAEHLMIERGSETDTDAGRYGLMGLLEPQTIRLCFPSTLQIVAWESMLVEQALDTLIHRGVPATRKELERDYGLQRWELDAVIKLARSVARTRTQGDIEEDRSLMLLRLEDTIRRARAELDLRNELAAYKQMAVVLGLARVEGNDPLTDFLEVVKKVAAERRPELPADRNIAVGGNLAGVVAESHGRSLPA